MNIAVYEQVEVQCGFLASGICLAASLLSHNHLTEISPVNDGLIGATCKRA